MQLQEVTEGCCSKKGFTSGNPPGPATTATEDVQEGFLKPFSSHGWFLHSALPEQNKASDTSSQTQPQQSRTAQRKGMFQRHHKSS